MRKVWFVLLISLTILAVLLYRYHDFYSKDQLDIYFLDVGQGDSILIKTPDYKYILIDGGPGDAVMGELNEVMPLWIRKIDLVILTHPDADHVTGIVEVLKYYEVAEVAYGPIDHKSNIYKEFLRTIDYKSIPTEDLRSEDDFTFGCCVAFDVLWPAENADLNTIEPVNNVSISLRLSYGDFEMILAGDAESATENVLAAQSDLSAELLKVSHHGSNTSSTETFLDDVHPETAIISAGKNNKFGHPTEETLSKLNSRNIKIFRTDISGTIHVVSSGQGYNIKCEISCN